MLRRAYEISGFCIKCGFCEPSCPTIPAFDNSPLHGPRGRILLLRELVSGNIEKSAENMLPFFSCLSCGACGDVCPAGVDAGEVSRLMRGEALKQGKAPGIVYVMRKAFLSKGDPLGMGELKWRPTGLPTEGRYLLFTGGLYQLMAYAEPAVTLLDRLKEKYRLVELSLRTGIAQFMLRFRMEKRYMRILDDISSLLKGSGVYYRPELDAYSGVLAYDLGMEEEFAEHAVRIGRKISGRKVVVLDPHTAYVLSEVYPKFVDSFDVEVIHYTEIVKGRFEFEGKAAYQEPCYLLRHFKREGIRPFLESVKGLELVKAGQSCCGGPIEFLFGERSKRIAMKRGEAMRPEEADVFVTACPVCMASFRRAGFKPTDLSTFLKFSKRTTINP